jgi:hypothetical protein
MMLQAVAHRLHNLPAVAAGHIDEPFESQHVVQPNHGAEPRKERIRILDRAPRHDKALEVVVIMPSFEIVG